MPLLRYPPERLLGRKERRSLSLEDVSVDGFGVVVDWMYSGVLPARVSGWTDDKLPLDYLRRAYKVADQLLMTELQNQLMDMVLAGGYYMRHTKLTSVSMMWSLGLNHTPMYDFVLRDCIRRVNGEPESEAALARHIVHLKQVPEAMADIIVWMNKWNHAPWGEVSRSEWCSYHNHPDGKKCAQQIVKPALAPKNMRVAKALMN